MKALIQEEKEQAEAVKQAAKLQAELEKRKLKRGKAVRSTATQKSKSLPP